MLGRQVWLTADHTNPLANSTVVFEYEQPYGDVAKAERAAAKQVRDDKRWYEVLRHLSGATGEAHGKTQEELTKAADRSQSFVSKLLGEAINANLVGRAGEARTVYWLHPQGRDFVIRMEGYDLANNVG